MYIPRHFAQSDPAQLHQCIRDAGLGTLVFADDAGLEANHLPFYLDTGCLDTGRPDSAGLLACHFARSNSAWQRLDGTEVLVIFQGPEAYISPSWYPAKAATGRVVPTWNYQAVHVRGRAHLKEDPGWLRAHLEQLTGQHESDRESPWSVDDAPAEFTAKLMQAIIGVEIAIESITGKLKASQNQPEDQRRGVRDGLNGEGNDRAEAMAQLIP